MTIRIRTMILIFAGILILVSSLFLITNLLIQNRIRSLEDAVVNQDIARFQQAVNNELARLVSISSDWSFWDETYNFIRTRAQDYIEGNLSNQSISVLDTNFLVFVNLQGHIVYSKGVDLNNGLDLTLPQDIQEFIEGSTLLTSYPRGVENRSGVILLPTSGHFLFASSPILRSDRSGPRLGTLILIRYVESTELQKLSRLSQTTISQTSAPANEDMTLFEGKEPGSIIMISNRIFTDTISSTLAWIDYTGETRVYMVISSDRMANTFFSTLTPLVFTIFIFVAIVTALLVWFLEQRFAIAPIDQLRTKVDKIGGEKNPAERLPVRSRDEVGRLSRSINVVLDGLQQSQLQVQGRMNQLRTVAEISRAATSVLEPQALLQKVAELVQQQFKLYYVGIFLLDEPGEYAVLNAGTGDPGRKMLEANHRLQVGGTSMIGWATSNRKARIALDVGKEAVRFENPLLPLTHSELAIPIISRAKAVGAISLQSLEVNAFTEEDIVVFQGIADALAVALENASLFQQTQKNLEDIRKLNRVYMQTTWAERLERTRNLSFAYTNPDMDQMKGDYEQVQFPITLRDQVLGTINLEVDPKTLTTAEKDLIVSISDQVALALENARLLETTQSRAAFERKLNTMAAEFSQKTRVEEILKSISKELSSLPTVNSVSIHLNPVAQAETGKPAAFDKKGEKDDDAIQF